MHLWAQRWYTVCSQCVVKSTIVSLPVSFDRSLSLYSPGRHIKLCLKLPSLSFYCTISKNDSWPTFLWSEINKCFMTSSASSCCLFWQTRIGAITVSANNSKYLFLERGHLMNLYTKCYCKNFFVMQNIVKEILQEQNSQEKSEYCYSINLMLC